MRCVLVVSTVGLVLSLGALNARTQAASAQIVGRVLDADAQAPIPGARVMLLAPSSVGTGPRMPLTTTTDANGEFVFTAVSPGMYVVAAQRHEFVSDSPMQQLQAIAMQTVAIDVFLKRGGVVTGRVLDERDDPIRGMRVTALSRHIPARHGGPAFFGGGPGVTTSDLGEFRIPGLADGEYLLVAEPQPHPPFNSGASARSITCAPTYYPGTTHVEEAHRISVRTGDTINELEFRCLSTSAVRVSGVVVDEAGQPVGEAMVTVRPRLANLERQFVRSTFIRANPDGSFAIGGLADGVYELSAVRMLRSSFSPSTFISTLDLTIVGTEQQITLDGSAITGVRLVVQPAR